MKKLRNLLLLFGLIFIAVGPVYADLPSSGDINGDGNVDVADAITALQILSQLPTSNLHPDNDIDKDGKIGMAEAIYALQMSAGLLPLPASGIVALPEGFALAPTTLTVSSAISDVALGADRSFTVLEPGGGGRATVLLTDANDNIVMLGHVDTDNPSANELSPTSTAVQILFLATGAFTLPQTIWTDVYRTLAAAPETATLAGVIRTQMVANPTAVGDMDPVIVDAITAAVVSLLPDLNMQRSETPESLSRGALAAIAPAQRTPLGDGTDNLAIKTTASDYTPKPAWGIVTEASDDHLGITFNNNSRIARYYIVYRTGKIPAGKKMTDPPEEISPWVGVTQGFIPAVNGINGGLTDTIYDYRKGDLWKEESKTIPLPLDPGDAVANTYQVYVVGMGAHAIADPADLVRNGNAEYVRNMMWDMFVYQSFKEFLWPLLTQVFPLDKNMDIWDDKDFVVGAVKGFLQEIGSVGTDWSQQILADPKNVWPASKSLVKGLCGLGAGPGLDALNALIKKFGTSGNLSDKNIIRAKKVWKFVDKLAGVVKVVDAALATVDIGTVMDQIAESNSYNIWNVFAAASTIALSPDKATLMNSQQTAPFSVKSSGYLPADLTYKWGPSGYGTFKTACGDANPKTCPGSQTATYVLTDNTTLPGVSNDTFQVDVVENKTDLSIGTLTGTVNFGNVVLKPYTKGKNFPEGTRVQFKVSLTTGAVPAGTNVRWSISSTGTPTGTINGGTAPVISSSTSVNYIAPMNPSSDSLEVQLTDKNNQLIGRTSTPINVVSGLIISPNISLSLGAEQAYTVSGTNGFVLPANAAYRWTVKGAGTLRGGNPTITSTPTVTYLAPSDASTKDRLTVQVVDQGSGKIVAQESREIKVGIVTWKGTSYSITNENLFGGSPAWSEIDLDEYRVDSTHVFFIGTSTDTSGDTAGSTYKNVFGSKTNPATVTRNGDGTESITLPSSGCSIIATSGKLCTAIVPSATLTRSSTGMSLSFPAAYYTWSHDCDDAVTHSYPFTLLKQ